MALNWQPDFKTWSADRVERAYAEDYELVVLEFSTAPSYRLIIWGIYTGRWFAEQIATGESMSLGQAKVDAEATLVGIINRATQEQSPRKAAAGHLRAAPPKSGKLSTSQRLAAASPRYGQVSLTRVAKLPRA